MKWLYPFLQNPRRFCRSLHLPHVRLHYYLLDWCEPGLASEMRADFLRIWPNTFRDCAPVVVDPERPAFLHDYAYRYATRVAKMVKLRAGSDDYPWDMHIDGMRVVEALRVGDLYGHVSHSEEHFHE